MNLSGRSVSPHNFHAMADKVTARAFRRYQYRARIGRFPVMVQLGFLFRTFHVHYSFARLLLTCLVFSCHFYLETWALIIDSGLHCDTNSTGNTKHY